MMESKAFLRFEDISLHIDGNEILQGVSLAVQSGKLITLIGPNGAGKSTLLKIGLGLLKSTQGVVHRKKGLRMGYIPQKFAINPLLPLTVSRFLSLTRGKQCSAREGLIRMEATHLIDRQLQCLSGGETQRVLLAKALMHAPHLLVLDEPTQGLDIDGQRLFYALLQKVRIQTPRMAIILASHDLYMVLNTSDHVVCLNRHICCMGHPDVVREDPSYLRLFGNTASPTLAPYAHMHAHETLLK